MVTYFTNASDGAPIELDLKGELRFTPSRPSPRSFSYSFSYMDALVAR